MIVNGTFIEVGHWSTAERLIAIKECGSRVVMCVCKAMVSSKKIIQMIYLKIFFSKSYD